MTNRIATVILFLALCAGAISARASAVVTFTVAPDVVSNTYNGVITLQINGLTNGVTSVVVQKYLDVNTNGVIDSGDLLVQQFRLAAGQLNVFTNVNTKNPVTVTNFMPGDTSTVTNQLTVPLNFQNGDFAQSLVGQYLYKISSPSSPSGFASVTNLFVVTNTMFSAYVTGAVVNAVSETNIPNALVLLCLNQNGFPVVQAGAVANNSGIFSLRAPAGNYFFAAAKSNFVESITNEGILLSGKMTTNYPIFLNSATTTVTGRVVNATSSNGLAGISGMAISTSNLLSFYFTDTNGYFSAPVATNQWVAPVDPFSAAFQGYLTWQSYPFFGVSNKVVSLTNALPPVTAIFYGVVSNSLAAPLPGVYVDAMDNAGHQSIGMTDSHGKYVVGISAGTNLWTLYIPPVGNPGITNPYAINLPYVQAAGVGTNGAVEQNFTLVYAPYTISGTVDDDEGHPIAGAEVFAESTNYQAFSDVTDTNGFYSLNVNQASWTVGVEAASLESLGYTNVADFPPSQTVSVSAPNTTVDFSMLVCGEIDIQTTNLPDAMVGQYYDTSILGASCQSITNWSTAYGATLTSLDDNTNFLYPAGTPIYSDSQIIGYVETSFSFGANANVLYSTNCQIGSMPTDGNSHYQWADITATITVSAPIPKTNYVEFPGANDNAVWTILPTTNGPPYTTTVELPLYPPSPDPPLYYTGGFACTAGSLMSATSGTASNKVASVIGNFQSIGTVGDSAVVALSKSYTNLDNSVVWIRYGTNLGQYFVSAYGPQTTNLDGLSLSLAGTNAVTLSGTPISTGTNGGTFNFSILAEDASANVTVVPFSLFVFPATGITGSLSANAAMLQSSNTFQMKLTGLTNEFNYTVLMSTNLPSTNWVPITTINNPTTNSLIIPDNVATNASRFYRLQISQ